MDRYGATIGIALGHRMVGLEAEFDPERVEILKRLVYDRLVRPDESDPLNVFIKQEPHKHAKLVEGRYRLIQAVSLVDTMVDRILYGDLCRKVLSTVGETPVLIGWSPLRGGYHYLIEKFRGVNTRGLDKTAWDWTVSEWVLEATYEVLMQLQHGASDSYKAIARKRWENLFRDARLKFKDGTEVRQPGWGVMKSGCYLTIVINSIGQMIYHALALRRLGMHPRSKRFVVIGDDVTIEDFPEFEEYESIIKHYGAILKPSKPVPHVEFAGFVSTIEDGEEKCWPEYWAKHLYVMTHTQKDPVSALFPYSVLYAKEPNFCGYVRMMMSEECPRSLLSERGCKSIWESTPGGCGVQI